MVSYTINVGGVDREGLAREVLNSAAKVLLLAGFSEDEVGDLFQQVSSQFSAATLVQSNFASNAHEDEDSGFQGESIWSLSERFEEHTAVKALNRLNKRASTFGNLEDAQVLQKAITLLTEAFALRRDAIGWLRSEAVEGGINVVADRDEWIESASDSELDEEDLVLFLDDYRWSGDFNWHLVGQVARTLANNGDQLALQSLSSLALDEAVALEHHVREDVLRSIETMNSYEQFDAYVASHSGAGELAQSEFFDGFIRQTSFPHGTYALEGWLDAMSRDGRLERYKRSNRWRILVV